MRTGVIRNPRSHGNRGVPAAPGEPGPLFAEPLSPEALAVDLARFAAESIELLVIDGGDGTVREVLSALPNAFGQPPLLTVIPSGKTNILAFDLGVRRAWTLDAAGAAAGKETPKVRIRAPLQVSRDGQPPLQGFVFGAAGLVRATALAAGVHRAGVFQNASVGLTLASAVAQFAAEDQRGAWRRGALLSLAIDDGPAQSGARLITMATTLHRLPFALRPFGPARPGLKYLDVQAPPLRLAQALPTLLWTRRDRWLERHGYRRGDAASLRLSLDSPFVLDGEVYPGGELTVTEAQPLRFLTP